jgi:hypothetical protein
LLFDRNAAYYPEVAAMEGSFTVRLTEWMWSVTCGDTAIFLLTGALAMAECWPVVQMLFFVGWPVVLCHAAWTFLVWRFVILADPVIAALVA